MVNILRYQYLFNPKARMGGVVMNRFYDGGGFGHLLGLMACFANQNWRLSFSLKTPTKSPYRTGLRQMQKFVERQLRLMGIA